MIRRFVTKERMRINLITYFQSISCRIENVLQTVSEDDNKQFIYTNDKVIDFLLFFIGKLHNSISQKACYVQYPKVVL